MKQPPGFRNHSMVLLRCNLRARAAALHCMFTVSLQVELTTRIFFGSKTASILELYHENPPYTRFGSLLTDSLMTCYVRHVARLISSRGSSTSDCSTHLYTNMHAPSLRADPTNFNHFECMHGAMCHAGDNVFTFAS